VGENQNQNRKGGYSPYGGGSSAAQGRSPHPGARGGGGYNNNYSNNKSKGGGGKGAATNHLNGQEQPMGSSSSSSVLGQLRKLQQTQQQQDQQQQDQQQQDQQQTNIKRHNKQTDGDPDSIVNIKSKNNEQQQSSQESDVVVKSVAESLIGADVAAKQSSSVMASVHHLTKALMQTNAPFNVLIGSSKKSRSPIKPAVTLGVVNSNSNSPGGSGGRAGGSSSSSSSANDQPHNKKPRSKLEDLIGAPGDARVGNLKYANPRGGRKSKQGPLGAIEESAVEGSEEDNDESCSVGFPG